MSCRPWAGTFGWAVNWEQNCRGPADWQQLDGSYWPLLLCGSASVLQMSFQCHHLYMENGSSSIYLHCYTYGEGAIFPCESRCYVVQTSLWSCLSTCPPVLWKSERNLSRKRKISLCKIHFRLFIFLFCECTAVGEDSPLIELASGLRLLVETTSSLPAERHLGWLILALWSQLAQPAKLLGVHKGTTKSVSLRSGEKHPMHEIWAMCCIALLDEVAVGKDSYYLSSWKKKGLRKELHSTFLFVCF